MGLGCATFGSTGTGQCTLHPPASSIPMSGFILNASVKSFVDGKGMARMYDMVVGDCGHIGFIVSASSKTFVDGFGAAYITSQFVGPFSGTIISGSGKTFTV